LCTCTTATGLKPICSQIINIYIYKSLMVKKARSEELKRRVGGRSPVGGVITYRVVGSRN
jgi:hypothetical protein